MQRTMSQFMPEYYGATERAEKYSLLFHQKRQAEEKSGPKKRAWAILLERTVEEQSSRDPAQGDKVSSVRSQAEHGIAQ